MEQPREHMFYQNENGFSIKPKEETESKQRDVFAKVDNCIITVCDKVQKEDCAPGEYADIVKALAELIEARASLY